MSHLLIFILVIIFGVLPLASFVYWVKYKNTIILKTAIAILATSLFITISSYIVGKYGLIHLIWFVPVGYLSLLLGNLIFKHTVQKPIIKLIDVLTKVSQGDLEQKTDDKFIDQTDEIGQINNTIVQLISNYKETANIAKEIGEGNFDYTISLLGENDHLRKSMLDMREELKTAAKIQKEQKIDDEKRKWINEGLAKFAEILRQHNNIEELSFEVINYLVTYLDANQGGIFIKNDDDDRIVFDLLSSIAYSRKKYLKKEIELGEGLVGTCAIEGHTIYMTELPQDYIEITSGLGKANPTSLLIVPLKIEEEVLGVVEMASFHEFEDFQIDFVERVSHNIASTLRTVKINQKTAELLERTQQQAEEMAAQEEEMRQNMEELQATQEESARKSEEMAGLWNALNDSSLVIEYDINGYVTDINDSYLNLIEHTRDQVIGTHHKQSMEFTEQQKKAYENFWADLKRGKMKKEKHTIKIDKGEFVLLETYTPIKDMNGNVIKILKIANDLNSY